MNVLFSRDNGTADPDDQWVNFRTLEDAADAVNELAADGWFPEKMTHCGRATMEDLMNEAQVRKEATHAD